MTGWLTEDPSCYSRISGYPVTPLPDPELRKSSPSQSINQAIKLYRTCESGSPQAWVLGGLSGIRPGSRQRHFILSKFNHNDAFSDMYIKR
jgi:hypothetical protein